MTKPPTAEEVLGLYLEYMELIAEWEVAPPDDQVAELAPQIALVRFEEAVGQYQASRGPVTREWFVERFGGEDLWSNDGISFVTINRDGRVFSQVRTKTPTRSDIETLVRLLGGEV